MVRGERRFVETFGRTESTRDLIKVGLLYRHVTQENRELEQRCVRLRKVQGSLSDSLSYAQDRLDKSGDILQRRNDRIRELESDIEERIQRGAANLADDLLEDAADTIRRLTQKNQSLAEMNAQLARSNDFLSKKRDFENVFAKIAHYTMDMKSLPRTVADVVSMAQEVFSDMLVFSDSPLGCNRSKPYTRDQVDNAWYMVKSLPLLWYLLFKEKDPDYIKSFKDATGLRFAPRETNDFKSHTSSMKRRRFMFDGEVCYCMWHIGTNCKAYGSHMRCYFYPDASIEKLKVGYVGTHL